MDLRELECFVAVYDHGGFSRAAGELGITQPAVSDRVARLERELGTALFERRGPRGARPTAAGRAAVDPARAALRAPETVRSAVAAHTGLLAGTLALGHVGSGAASTLLEPLLAFRAAHPRVEVSLVEESSDVLTAGLVDGRLDLAWIATAGPLPAVLAGRRVLDEPVVVATPDTADGRRRTSWALADLAEVDLVALPRGNGARDALDVAAREAGTRLEVALEVSSLDLVRALVERGAGVAVLSRPLAVHLGLHAAPLMDLRSRLVLAWRRDRPPSPAVSAFRDLLSTRGGGAG